MDSTEQIRQVKTTFTKPFNEEIFRTFSRNLLKDLDESKAQTISGRYIKEAFKPHVTSYKRVGSYHDDDGETLDVLIVKLTDSRKLDSARTMQRNFVADYLKTRGEKDSAIVAFYNENYGDWRFSYVRMEYKVELSDEGQVKVKEELTPARRYSFLVGENEPNHTAQQQISPLLGGSEKLSLAEIEEAFNIESITKEFFNKYKDLFVKLKDEIDANLASDNEMAQVFANHEISTANFAKKLMGQIVFLYFVQKKGWLGVPEDKDWGDGDKKFLQTLFAKCKSNGKNFFTDYLEPLFYDALNNRNRGTVKPDYHPLFKCKIPFLNGGLFEPMNGYDWKNTELKIGNEIFVEIFDTFELYNFTVREDEPLEKEVAVDPEMLGKVFENLLEVIDRRSKGAFYTPREIVHYMCQESLLNYLDTKLNNKVSRVPRQDIKEFIQRGDIYIDYAIRNEAKRDEGKKIAGIYKQRELPDSIIDNAVDIDGLLNDIKICDPAIGSGAFPVGMMNEIVRARYALSAYGAYDPDRTPYAFKRQCIQDCIYGVDIDSGAIDIAKLRLWLSLIVDEEDFKNIQPLPNLDYKIMQGNSLLEEYEGIKLFDEKIIKVDDRDGIQREIDILTDRQMAIQKEYVALHLQANLTDIQKMIFDSELKKIKSDLKKLQSPQQKKDTGDVLGLFNGSEAKNKADRLSFLHERFFDATLKSKKELIRQEIDTLEWDLIETTLKEHDKLDKLDNIARLRKSNVKPFFLWKLHFSEVFKKNGGFDIVIGNPPYIQIQKFAGQQVQKDLEAAGFETFARTGDIYSLFYEKGCQILRPNGHVCLITSNKWMRAKYGESLRKFLSQKNPVKLIDLGAGIFDTATVDTNILIIENATTKELYFKAVTLKNNFSIDSLQEENFSIITNLSESSWVILSPIEQRIKEKIEKVGTPLKDWDIKINYGIKTGYNEAFIIDEETKDRLIKEDPKSAEIIRPILRGRDIKKYKAEFANLWLINTHNGIKGKNVNPVQIENYPAIKRHLDKYYSVLAKRTDKGDSPYNLRNCAYMEDFFRPKIVWTAVNGIYSFTYLNNNEFFNNSIFMITTERHDLKYLLALMNSTLVQKKAMEFFTGLSAYGKYTYGSKDNMGNIPIPIISEEESAPFVDLVNASLEKKRESIDSSVEENGIDQLVYNLYGLTQEEIEYIEFN